MSSGCAMDSIARCVADLSRLSEESASFCSNFGILMLDGANRLVHAPLSLTPATRRLRLRQVPKTEFQRALDLAPIFNKLCSRIASHPSFLRETLSSVAQKDEFTGKLLELYEQTQRNERKQLMSLDILRSDYMLHKSAGNDNVVFKQVELNTIASAFASLSTRLSELHRFLYSNVSPGIFNVGDFPQNCALKVISDALAQATLVRPIGQDGSSNCLLIVVQDGEKNSNDQRTLEYELWMRHGITTLRRSLRELHEQASIDPDSGDLRVFVVAKLKLCVSLIWSMNRSNRLCGCVYYRAGYTPCDYSSSGNEWAARLLIEKSMAVKCPSVSHHLVGTKKVQQALCDDGVLEKFVSDSEAAALRVVFAQQWSLDVNELSEKQLDDIINMAISQPDGFVLKPQREGGGNNYYGSEMVAQLVNLPREDLGEFVLMERLDPPPEGAIIMRNGEAKHVNLSISEFGFYSAYLSDGESVLLDCVAGNLVRTKPFGVNEGGVATGYAVLSTPRLL